MNSIVGKIITCIVFVFFILLNRYLGYNEGVEAGREQVFNGSYACMKLPDNTTYCYKVEAKNR